MCVCVCVCRRGARGRASRVAASTRAPRRPPCSARTPSLPSPVPAQVAPPARLHTPTHHTHTPAARLRRQQRRQRRQWRWQWHWRAHDMTGPTPTHALLPVLCSHSPSGPLLSIHVVAGVGCFCCRAHAICASGVARPQQTSAAVAQSGRASDSVHNLEVAGSMPASRFFFFFFFFFPFCALASCFVPAAAAAAPPVSDGRRAQAPSPFLRLPLFPSALPPFCSAAALALV